MKRKGFTLIEVLIATVVLAIVSVVFLGMFSGAYRLQMQEKYITKNTYSLQQRIEQQIGLAKKAAESGGYFTDADSVANAFGQSGFTVKAKQISMQGASHEFFTLVADVSNTNFYEVSPRISSLDLVYKKGGSTVRSYDYVPSASATADTMELTITPVAGTTDALQHYMVYWYASNPWYSIPNVSDIFHVGNFQVFPYFPHDYELVYQTTRTLKGSEQSSVIKVTLGAEELKKLKGRHIVASVVPVTKLAVFGEAKNTDPIYLHSVEKTDDLLLHFNASVIKESNINKISREITSPYTITSDRVLLDFGDTTGKKLKLYAGYELENNVDSITYSGYGIKMSDTSYFRVNNASDGAATAFVIAKAVDLNDLSGLTWDRDIDAIKGYRIYKTVITKNDYADIKVSQGVTNDNMPSILGILVYSGDKANDKYFVDGIEDVVSTHFQNVASYANQIKELRDIEARTIGSYQAPKTVTAVLRDGRHRQVSVVWDEWKDLSGKTVEEDAFNLAVWNFGDLPVKYTKKGTYMPLESGTVHTMTLTLWVDPCPVRVSFNPTSTDVQNMAVQGMTVGTELEYQYAASFGPENAPIPIPDWLSSKLGLRFSIENASQAQLTDGVDSQVVVANMLTGTIRIKGIKPVKTRLNATLVDLSAPSQGKSIGSKDFRVYSLQEALDISLSPKGSTAVLPKIFIDDEYEYSYSVSPRIKGLLVPAGLSVLGVSDTNNAAFVSATPAIPIPEGYSGDIKVKGLTKGDANITAKLSLNSVESVASEPKPLRVLNRLNVTNNMVLWLDGNDDGAKYMTKDTWGVSQWKDLSGKNNHFSASGSPVYQSGGGISFNGSNQYLKRNGLSNINYGRGDAYLRDSTVFVVAISSNSDKGTLYSQERRRVGWSNNPATFQFAINSRTRTLSAKTGQSGLASVVGNGFSDMANNKFISVAVTEGKGNNLEAKTSLSDMIGVTLKSGKVSVNAVQYGHGTDKDFFIGVAKDYSGYYDYLNGTVYEVIIFNKTLSDEEIEDVVSYLRDKWK